VAWGWPVADSLPPFDEAAPAGLADEAALLHDHLAPADGEDGIAGDGEAVIRAIVDRGVEGLGREGHRPGRVEEDEVRIVAREKVPLPRQPEDPGRVGAAHFHPAVEAEAAGAHTEVMDEGQARLKARYARAGFTRRPRVGAVIARDDVERAVGQRLPQ